MSNIIDLTQYLDKPPTRNFREYAGKMVDLAMGTAGELPQFAAGLTSVADGYAKYLNNERLFGERDVPSYWDVACGLSFSAVQAPNGEVTSITFSVFNGRAVENFDPTQRDAVRQGVITLIPQREVVGFGEFHNEKPDLVYLEWLQLKCREHGIRALLSPNLAFFADLLRAAYANGFRLHGLNSVNDKLSLELLGKNEQMEVMVNFALFKSTHDIITRMAAAEEAANPPTA
jgi:hypothetical protein